jgi:hypothetical protein
MPVPCMPCSQEVATAAGPNLRGGHMARGMGRLTAAVSAVGQLPRQPETYKGMTAKLPGASLLKEIVRDGRHALLDDEDQRCELEGALERLQARQPFLADGFARREVNARFRDGEHRRLMHQGC